MRSRRKILLLVIAVFVTLLIVWSYRPAAMPVSVVMVSRGPLQVLVEEDGQTRIRERYTVTPPVSGYMRRVDLHVGDAVAAGQVLFRLEPLPPGALDARARAEAEARVSRAQAALRTAQVDAEAALASATLAAREQARLGQLLESGQVARAQYDRTAAEKDRATAGLAAARAAIDMARYEKQAAETSLRHAAGERGGAGEIAVPSPIGGTVLDIRRESEGVVAAGEPVLVVGDPRSLELVTEVLSADAVRIRPGMQVQVDRWGGGEALEARVRTVAPLAFTKVSALGIEEQRVRVVSDLVSPATSWAALGDAYRVETRFVLWESPAALRVPHSSLFRNGDGWAVFVVQDGRAQRRSVRIGQRGVLHAEVIDGLREGDAVVTYPDDRLGDGVRVKNREAGPGGPVSRTDQANGFLKTMVCSRSGPVEMIATSASVTSSMRFR